MSNPTFHFSESIIEPFCEKILNYLGENHLIFTSIRYESFVSDNCYFTIRFEFENGFKCDFNQDFFYNLEELVVKKGINKDAVLKDAAKMVAIDFVKNYDFKPKIKLKIPQLYNYLTI